MAEAIDLQSLIDQAYDFKRRLEYEKAHERFVQAIEALMQILKSPGNEERTESLKKAISDLMDQAEYCKLQLNPQRRHDQQVFNYVRNEPKPAVRAANPTNRSEGEAQSRPGATQANAKQTNEQLSTYEESILNEVVDRSPSVDWTDIAGLETAKEQLQEAIIKPTLFPHIYTGIRSPPKGILLFGPPGTGKTLLAKAVASESKAFFLSISASSLTSKFYGEAEKLVRAMFAVARKHQPAVIFIDELDSILSSRSEGQHDASRRLQTEFLVQMDGVRGDSEERTVIIGATNRPQEIDEAVRRRFTKRIYIELPNNQAREILIRHLMGKVFHELGNNHVNRVVQLTQHFSGSDLSALCKEAAMVPLRNLTTEQMQSGAVPPVTLSSFEEALKMIRPSVSRDSLAFYQQWNREYGSN